MNIPLDRLYHFIDNVATEIYGDSVIIYRFWPHGSKNISNLNHLNSKYQWIEKLLFPLVWCNDQEPLDYEFYKENTQQASDSFSKLMQAHNMYLPAINLNYRRNIFEKNLLLHSEQRSINLEKYQLENELIPVYYWSHGIISRDWFRFAEHVNQKKQIEKTFLIYNRAWAGTREYRLKFADTLVRLGLEKDCKMSINPIEPELGMHYELHTFKNPAWRPTNVLENFFPTSNAHSHYSADFDIEDYEATNIEVVLETLFDDSRLHLTEKSLRPIACGQPFILAGTHGSLEYLRSYGFKTFENVWSEGYDLIEDPEERLYSIADLMKQIANWSPEVKEQKLAEAQVIADYNKQHFFSKEFFNQVIAELKTNLKLAFNELYECNNYQAWINRYQKLLTYPDIIELLNNSNQDTATPTIQAIEYVISVAQTKLTEFKNNKYQDE